MPRRLLPLAVAGLVLAGATACASSTPQASTAAAATPVRLGQDVPVSGCVHPLAPVKARNGEFAAVGDSITAGDSPDIDHGLSGSRSWATYATGDGMRFVGGWALGGTTTETMAQHVTPFDADVLVVMAGTNDMLQNVPFAATAAHLELIVRKAAVPRVVLSGIAPNDAMPEVARAFSTRLRMLAAQQGWRYVDPMSGIRTPANRYRAGLTQDGTHPIPLAARRIGSAVEPAIESACTHPAVEGRDGGPLVITGTVADARSR